MAVKNIMPLYEVAPLPPELASMQVEIEGIARDYGLDFFPTIFELVDADRLKKKKLWQYSM